MNTIALHENSGGHGAWKTVAFAMGLCIAALAIAGFIMPVSLAWVAQHAVTPGIFYLGAVVRIGLGVLLIAVAADSRAPVALRVLGFVVVIAGISTGLTGMLAIDRARVIVDWWLHQGAMFMRATTLIAMAIGGFIAYACAPSARHAV